MAWDFNALDKMFEENKKSEKTRLDAEEANLPTAITNMLLLSNEELVNLYDEYPRGSLVAGKREFELREKFRAAMKTEILKRLGN